LNSPLRIGILGTRGIPNRYGGFEQCAEKLAVGLVERGHDVWVYNSHKHEFQGDNWNGAHIIHCNDPEHRLGTAGQFIYDLNCYRDANHRNFDILLQMGYSSSSVWYRWWPRYCPNVVNMDGLEWRRTKYNPAVRRFLRRAEKWAAQEADVLIADSLGIQNHLKSVYRKDSIFIPYGADLFDNPDSVILREFGLRPYQYDLLIARMEPENNVETVISGHIEGGSPRMLVIVGNTGNAHGEHLLSKFGSNPAIKFLGAIFDAPIVNNLRYFSCIYFHGHSVGGTNPSLLEAMACQALVAAHDNAFNRAVLGNDALYFNSPAEVASLLQSFKGREELLPFVTNNLKKIRDLYNWPRIVDAYEQTLIQTVNSWRSLP
jgi:hypothetical protein